MVKRGEVYYANLNPVTGSEQGGIRPVIIIQNDVGNKYSPTVIIAAITSRTTKAKLPTHIEINDSLFVTEQSLVLLEQIRTIDKSRLKKKLGEISTDTMKKIDEGIRKSFFL